MSSTQLSYLSGVSDTPLLGITIGDKFDEIVMLHGDKEALVVKHQSVRWTYNELDHHVKNCAKALMAIGIQKGDRVGVWSPNRSEWVVAQFATAKMGAILVNINPSYRLHELKYALNQSECSAIIIADQFKSSNYTQMMYDLAPELENCEAGKLKCAGVSFLNSVIRLHDGDSPGMFNWNSFLELGIKISDDELANRQKSLTFDEPINIQYTSGTTGYPKGATLSHHNILNNGYFVARAMNFTAQDRLIIPVPLYHCFGMVMGNLGCMTHGATIIFASEGFESEKVLKAVEEEKATALYGVPTMFIAELEHPNFEKYDLSSLRTGIMAGSSCPIEVMKKVQTLMNMKDVQIAYGMTETSPVSTQTRIGTPLEKQVSTVGQVHPHVEVKVIDPESGVVVPVGVAGELCTRGYSVMLGYWKDEEKTRSAIDSARWMHTGDLATIDVDGYVNIVGRIKDMIIRGGENIYPREIEEFLYGHPAISDVQVIGIPDKKFGEEVMAWIKLKDGVTATSDDIKSFCKGHISHFKIPKLFKFTDEFPTTVTGKIRKVEMREISMRELKLDDEASITTA